ncbi:transcription initiation factor TFIID subunit 1 [Kluyveromyces marxianus]|nr:transcription initiation factor TFIID subunit 1 [Kluyveromyces marxianus]
MPRGAGSSGGKKQAKAKKDLSHEDEAYNALFSGEFGALEIANYTSAGGKQDETEHLPNAIDFEDEDELADEELPEEEEPSNRNGAGSHVVEGSFQRSLSGEDEYMTLIGHGDVIQDDGEPVFDVQGNNALFMESTYQSFGPEQHQFNEYDEQHRIQMEEQRRREEEENAKEEELLFQSYFPELKPGRVLRMTKIAPKPLAHYQWQRELYLRNRVLKPLIPLKIQFQVQKDTRKLFKTRTKSSKPWQGSLTELTERPRRNVVKVSLDEIYPEDSVDSKRDYHDEVIPEDLLIVADEWDYEKIVDDRDTADAKGDNSSDGDKKSVVTVENTLEETGKDWEWNEDDIINGKMITKEPPIDMNDEQLLILPNDSQDSAIETTSKVSKKPLIPYNEKSLLAKFNISNDETYKILKKNYQTKIRSTISNLNIEHSQPATRLQSPFYKVFLPKEQLRHFHRNHFGKRIRPGTNIVFSKIKTRKRKKDRGKDVHEIFQHSSDLTVGDSAQVFLMEFSEQQPIALSKFGMANKLINYYRKTDENDTSRPKLPVGETHVLGVQDKSPFWNFGFVSPGNIVPTLYNNMIRAPVFKHEVSKTDFLLVKSTGNGSGNRFYLRQINHLFTVGQTFPVVEVPGPNSRKVTAMGKNRLRMVVYRILNKSPEHRLLVKQVARHFPEQNDMQNRQRLKEFMKYQREGDDQGFWKLKEGEVLLDNENVKKMITPEDVSLVESMYYGQQFQEDIDFYNFEEKAKELEENLIFWNATKNFLNATQMRAMIQIHGAGDPTGCGEGFSFLKTSMKGGFVKSGSKDQPHIAGGHSYNVAQQQKAYEEEISRTWYHQAKSLSIQNPFEEMDDPDIVNESNKNVPSTRPDEKVLRIVRKKRDSNGIIQRQTVIIRDPRVIQGYLRAYEKRREEAERNLGLEELINDNINIVGGENEEERQLKQKKLLEEQLAKLEKSKERRQARKAAREKTKDGKVTKAKNTTRRCATCGAIGHIRTNKSCPMYNGGVAANAAAAAQSGSTSSLEASSTTPGPGPSSGPGSGPDPASSMPASLPIKNDPEL